MAKRPIFIPSPSYTPFVKEDNLEFEWYPGFSKIQAQKSIRSFHKAAEVMGYSPILEISSKSEQSLGVKLSAFNLRMDFQGQTLSVECAFQGSKVFTKDGPFNDLYYKTSIEAKKDFRLKDSGELIGFEFFGKPFPTKPLTAFYDWLYLVALSQNKNLASQLLVYQGFSDIAFNPEKSINCQARSAALFVALSSSKNVDMERLIHNVDYYLSVINPSAKMEDLPTTKQLPLF